MLCVQSGCHIRVACDAFPCPENKKLLRNQFRNRFRVLMIFSHQTQGTSSFMIQLGSERLQTCQTLVCLHKQVFWKLTSLARVPRKQQHAIYGSDGTQSKQQIKGPDREWADSWLPFTVNRTMRAPELVQIIQDLFIIAWEQGAEVFVWGFATILWQVLGHFSVCIPPP